MKAFFVGLLFLPLWGLAQGLGETLALSWKKLALSKTSIVFYVRVADNGPLAGVSISILETRQLLITDQFGYSSCILPSTTRELHLLITRPGYAPSLDTVMISHAEGREVVWLKPWVETNQEPMRVIPCGRKSIFIWI